MALPLVDAETGVQLIENGKPLFGDALPYGLLTILSTASWGLGYFGMPQVLLRFMAIRKSSELKRSRRIATVWVVISLFSAVFIGVLGRYLLGTDPSLITKSGAKMFLPTFQKRSMRFRRSRHHHGRYFGGNHQLV